MNFVRPTGVGFTIAEVALTPQSRRKWPISYNSVSAIAMMTDIASILVCGVVCGAAYNFELFGAAEVVPQYLGSAAVVAAFYVSVMKGQDLYSPTALLSLKTQVTTVITTWLGVFLFLSGAVFALKIGNQFSRVAIFSFAASGLVFLTAQRILYRKLLRYGLDGRRFSGRRAVLITDEEPNSNSDIVATLLRHGFQLQRQFALQTANQHGPIKTDVVSDIVDYVRGSEIEEVIVSINVKRWDQVNKLVGGLRKLPLPVTLIPAGAGSDLLHRPLNVMGDAVCINLQREPLDAFERTVKRTVDIVGALCGLVLLLPVLIMVAISIIVDSPGPIFFRQRRAGFNGRDFYIYKFRTMSVLEDGEVVEQAAQRDARVTRVGRWLRRASIDELPQLFNVIGGTMSLVGPRPHAVAHDNHFNKLVGNYAFRHHVKPGLTGWAQVHGHRGATPSIAEIRQRVEFDLWYIDNWSLGLDSLIILRTVFEVLRARNAY